MRLSLLPGLVLAVLALTARPAFTALLVQPDGSGDYPTIQAAIDAAVDGDSVLLGNGTLTGFGNRDLDFLGKAIVVASESGDAEVCIIDCEGSETYPAKGVRFATGEDSSAVLRDVTITGAWSSERGAAVEIVGSWPTLVGVRLIGNGGTGEGTACYVDRLDTDDSEVRRILSCQFIDNDGPSVIYAEDGEVTLDIVGCEFTGNRGRVIGWGGYFEGASPGDDPGAMASVANGALSFRGVSPGDSLRVVSCLFDSNDQGHCISASFGYERVIIRDCDFLHNDGGIAFGSHWSANETWEIEGCDFLENRGVAIVIDDTDYTFLRNCSFEGHVTGAVELQGESHKTVEECRFVNNSNPGVGGALFANEWYLNLTVRDTEFIGNTSLVGGGAIFGHENTFGLLLERCNFVGNTAPTGGAVDSRGTGQEFRDCVFSNNQAAGRGGAVRTFQPGATISGCLFFQNDAEIGGGLYSSDNLVLESSTFVGNTGSTGSHVFMDAGFYPVSVEGVIAAFGGGSGRAVEVPQADNTSFACTDIFGNSGGDWSGNLAPFLGTDGNISADPLFCDLANADLSLATTSPCLVQNNDCGTMGAIPDPGCVGEATVYPVYADGSGDYPTIQSAIDAAVTGDSILLGNGTYTGPGNRDLNSFGKNLVILSESGTPEDCVIDCEGTSSDPHRAFVFLSGEDSSAVLQNITLRNGAAFGSGTDRFGGAIYCAASSPSIRGCVFEANRAERNGGAINLFESEARIEGCVIRGNEAPLGGGLNSSSSSPEIARTQITGNLANEGGGAARFHGEYGSSPTISSTTISGNRSILGGGVLCASACSLRVWNTIVWDNCATDGPDFRLDDVETGATLQCSNVVLGNVSLESGAIFDTSSGDNIAMPPLFCGGLDCVEVPSLFGDFTLDAASPCLEGASPTGCDLIGAYGEGCDVVSGTPELVAISSRLTMSCGPNPFTGRTTLQLVAPGGQLEAAVFDASGKRVRTLISRDGHSAGVYSIPWDGTNEDGLPVASGVYFCRAIAGKQASALQLVLLRR